MCSKASNAPPLLDSSEMMLLCDARRVDQIAGGNAHIAICQKLSTSEHLIASAHGMVKETNLTTLCDGCEYFKMNNICCGAGGGDHTYQHAYN